MKGFKPKGEVGVHAVDGPVWHGFPVLLIRQGLRRHFHRAIAYARVMVYMRLTADRADEGMALLWANIQRPWTKGWVFSKDGCPTVARRIRMRHRRTFYDDRRVVDPCQRHSETGA
jgi:hypothetical protein